MGKRLLALLGLPIPVTPVKACPGENRDRGHLAHPAHPFLDASPSMLNIQH
jgi:hypothetical protein